MRVRIKICGVTRVEDALAAAHLGADAVGLVFAESPRRVTVDQAAEIVRSLPSFVCPVGVFVDARCEEVLETARAVGLHCVQLAGSEAPGYLEGLAGLSVIKVIHVGTAQDVGAAGDYQDAAILLDTVSRGAAGGTGESFPWEYALDLAAARPVILAGGLGPGNVTEAVSKVRPWAVDVSSGVEASPGVKDSEKMREFVAAARSIDHAESRR